MKDKFSIKFYFWFVIAVIGYLILISYLPDDSNEMSCIKANLPLNKNESLTICGVKE